MKPLNNRGETVLRHVDWPDPPDGFGRRRAEHLFAPRPAFRKLVAVIDDELTHDVPTRPMSQRLVLSNLLTHEWIVALRYLEEGPRPEARVTDSPIGQTYDGWVKVSGPDSYGWAITYAVGDLHTSSAVVGNAVDVARRDAGTTSYSDLRHDLASERRAQDALAAQVASQAVGADIYITERPYVHERENSLRGTVVCDVRAALGLIGLYLRAQDQYIAWTRHTVGRGTFYWVGARDMLPESWRWFRACVDHSGSAQDDYLLMLGQSALQRVTRSLAARDAVLIAASSAANHDSMDRALGELDNVLLNLMGAFDAAARVAHATLNLNASAYTAGWQRQSWRRKLADAEPELAALVELGTSGHDVLTILSQLRNSIHGEAVTGVQLRSGSDRSNVFLLPASASREVHEAFERRGGAPAWGASYRQWDEGRVSIDASVFVDRLLVDVLELLNSLMGATPVERLSGFRQRDDQDPPFDDDSEWSGPFAIRTRLSIRWQLGLIG